MRTRLSISGQAKLLGISRGSVYDQRRPSSPADLALMRRMDALHVEYPFAGSRMLRSLLRQEGSIVGRLHVATLMKRMGIAALYRRPTTSHPTPGRQIYPYLLRKLAVARPNQVWAMDITSVPMARGFVYLVAVVDWFSRKVLAWRLSITLETEPCLEALSEALARHGRPEIMNTDQGSQFTSVAFLTALQDAKIAISMDGKGAWRDNVFVERLWRTITDEEVYLRAYRRVFGGASRAGPLFGILQPAPTAFLTWRANARSGLWQPANAKLGGGITSAEIHLSTAHKLFKIDEPPL